MKVRINLHELFNTLGTRDFEGIGENDPNIKRIRKHLKGRSLIAHGMSELVLFVDTDKKNFVVFVEDCTAREPEDDTIVSDVAFFDRDGICEVAQQDLVNKFLLDKLREDDDAGN